MRNIAIAKLRFITSSSFAPTTTASSSTDRVSPLSFDRTSSGYGDTADLFDADDECGWIGQLGQ
jgi:hypothetical protein